MLSSSRPTVIAGAVVIAALLGLAWFVTANKSAGPMAGGAPGGFAGPQAGGAPGGAPPGAPAGGQRPNGGVGAGGRPGAGQPVAVVAVPVKQTTFEDSVEALGTARANESVDITAKTANRIVAIRFGEGQQVRKGEILVEMDGAEARADLAVAEAALGESRSQFNRSRELFATKALSQSQLEQIEATLRQNEARVASAQARVDDMIIRAPFTGRVGLRNVSVGSYVSPAIVITTLDDTSIIKLDFSVPETFLTLLANGLEIQATSSAYAGQQFSGKVASIDSRIDPVSRSVIVRGNIDNRDGRLKPGMFMTVRLVQAEDQALALPEQALVPENDRQYVFVVRDDQAHKTEITTGRRRPGEVEVLKGLVDGDIVVVEGTQKIGDGTPVRISSETGARTAARGQQEVAS